MLPVRVPRSVGVMGSIAFIVSFIANCGYKPSCVCSVFGKPFQRTEHWFTGRSCVVLDHGDYLIATVSDEENVAERINDWSLTIPGERRFSVGPLPTVPGWYWVNASGKLEISANRRSCLRCFAPLREDARVGGYVEILKASVDYIELEFEVCFWEGDCMYGIIRSKVGKYIASEKLDQAHG